MSSDLCAPCSQILVKNKTNGDFCPHHSSATELLECSCHLCKVLCDGFRNSSCPLDAAVEAGGSDFMTFEYRALRDRSMEESQMSIWFSVKYPNRKEEDGASVASQKFFRQKILVAKSDDNEGSKVTSGNTGSAESWNVATRWLERCLNTHPKCARTPSENWMPTRVLDVGTHGSNYIHLRETDERFPAMPYTTLSHCWGKIEIIRLLRDNFDAMLKGIRIEELPKTFQDAIIITRRLNIRYTWIDSLCILQDSTTDWANESSKMGQVYQNGLCNIAATGAPDGRWGCFLNRDPMLVQRCRVHVEAAVPKWNLQPGLYDLVPSNLWEHGLLNSALTKRAWVAQERILAPRLLHFSNNQLFWECNALDACEMFPNGAPPVLAHSESVNRAPGSSEFGFKRLNFKNLDPASVRSEVQVKKTPWTIPLVSPLPSGPLIDPYYVWNKVLLAYTRCALTKENDKLVAISAVAKQIQGMAKDKYLAGMWRRYLEYHLLWLADQGDQKRVRTDNYVAPSWSWASMIGRVEPFLYIRPDTSCSIRILDVKVETVTSDITGQVSGGFLKLRGWLKKVSLKDDKSWTMRIYIAHWRPVPQVWRSAEFDEYHEYQKYRDGELWYLPVVTIGLWRECEVYGLMLVETGRADEFRRVGRFRAESDIANAFRRPAYPSQDDGVMTGGKVKNKKAGVEGRDLSNENGNTDSQKLEKRGWFGMRQKTDEAASWKERVITII